eukprot:TRINITY_DN3139_c0_g1_i5.p1 TRINITY_DN3139_c0_g1~~TRINITY_DN3139_c0_g1_i5.p1  ORF type:complete len:702 (-),score=217.51 TRINITY_DN3139_c0_g1_i5:260-2365(-)
MAFNPAGSQYDFNNVRQPAPPTAMQSRSGRPVGTAARQNAEARPLTSNRAAKFSSKPVDPMNQTASMKAPTFELQKKVENGPDEIYKKTEREINNLIEESTFAAARGATQEALEKAKDAATKEKGLRKQKETAGFADSINLDLTQCVTFNLGVQYQNCGLYTDALNQYTAIVKNKAFQNASRLRVNMGNIYFLQKNYSVAIKMYRMALDTIPKTFKDMRFRILKNIGNAFVKLGQFQDAITSFESVMEGSPDFQTAFNLLVCLYALGDRERMKKCFAAMLAIEIPGFTEDVDVKGTEAVLRSDTLQEEMKDRQREAFKYIVDAAKLIAPAIESDIITGYEWLLATIKASNYPAVESEIEICKAMSYLAKRDVERAIETLKSFEQKDKQLMARAATNISSLYFLENDFKNAEKYAEVALAYDRYNAKALVNKGNCLYMKNEFLRAKEQYLEAIGVEADCVEALYNLAFVNKKINAFIEALQALEKLQTIVPGSPEVIYQIASIHEMMSNTKQAIKWYQILLSKVPSDPTICTRLGFWSSREDDETQALHYYSEAYRFLPSNMEAISWLGIYYVKAELYEKAAHFFERAAQIQPKEIKWRLMVASCYRRMGAFQKSLKLYEEIYQEAPENIECLRFLVQLCKEMGLKYDHYSAQLRKLERAIEAEQARFAEYGGGNEFDEQQQQDDQQSPEESPNVQFDIQRK